MKMQEIWFIVVLKMIETTLLFQEAKQKQSDDFVTELLFDWTNMPNKLLEVWFINS